MKRLRCRCCRAHLVSQSFRGLKAQISRGFGLLSCSFWVQGFASSELSFSEVRVHCRGLCGQLSLDFEGMPAAALMRAECPEVSSF